MATRKATRWHGQLEGWADGLAFGWCVDSRDPDARTVIELSLDGEAIGTVVADVARTDLAARLRKLAGAGGDVCHGFVADMRAVSASRGTLTAKVANTDHVLDGRIAAQAGAAARSPVNNFVFGDGGLRVHGWCRGRDARRGAITVRAFVGSREVARAQADERHPTLRPFGVEADGFVLDLPPDLADGKTHSVRVVDAEGVPLQGSPVMVCCLLEGARALVPARGGELLAAAIESYERHVPRSLGFDFYPAWRDRFEDEAAPATKLRAAIVIAGSDDAAAVSRTRRSLAAQRGSKPQIFTSVREALASRCDAVGIVRAGDELRANAISFALQGLDRTEAKAVYTDSEFEGRPWFKPAWNLDYALASDYPLELLLARSAFARAHQPPRPAGAGPAAFAWGWLAAAAASGPHAVVHVPRALYVWNSAPGKKESHERAAAASAALAALDPKSNLVELAARDTLFQPRRIVRPLSRTDKALRVSLVIPTRDRVELLERCIDSIRRHTKWSNLEIIVVDNDSAAPETLHYFRSARRKGVKVLKHPGAFNFSAMNNRAIEKASGAIVGLINNDIEATHDGWLDEIVGQLLRPGVGAVGAKLAWPNGMVQHGGVLLGVGNAAGHFGNRLADGDWGDHGRNQLAQQLSGVTAACLFMRRKDYLALGGMDEVAFPVTFNDVDLCLRLRERGQAIVWTPHARLLHAESASRGKEDAPAQRSRAQRELDRLRERWGAVLLRDPAYHPSLNLDPHSHAFGGLAIPPRDRSPRTGSLTR